MVLLKEDECNTIKNSEKNLKRELKLYKDEAQQLRMHLKREFERQKSFESLLEKKKLELQAKEQENQELKQFVNQSGLSYQYGAFNRKKQPIELARSQLNIRVSQQGKHRVREELDYLVQNISKLSKLRSGNSVSFADQAAFKV